MKIDPSHDPDYVRRHPYRCLSASEYTMGREYRIVREGGLEDHLILLTLSGGGIADGTVLAPFSLHLFKPHERHDYGTDPKAGFWHFLWAHIHAPTDWLPLLDWKTISIQSIPQGERRRIVALFRDVVANSSTGSGYDEALAMNLLENMLLRLSRARAAADDLDFGEKARAYVLEHLAEPLDVAALAAKFSLSPSRFAHRFRDAFGTTPQAYVEGCRIAMARRLLLTTTLSVKEIAFASGFKDPLYFSKRFARMAGNAPSAWRRLN
ncbi:MAG: helix-turn-helix domain-containing protein [Kiritimatiellae bacterium]|nr:helix-turn-helix domain-containing protein [Kiritimatiellia bacterium]